MHAKQTMASKLTFVFSHQSANRLKRFDLPTACSMRARVLYGNFGKNLGLFLVFERYGMIGAIPRFRHAVRFAFESEPLSVIAARGRMSGPISREHTN